MDVETLIQRAYRLSQRIPATGDTPDASLIQIGLELLNYIIKEININGREIVLTTSYTTNLTPDVEIVSLAGFIDIYEIYYMIGNIRYTVFQRSLTTYFDEAATTATPALPWTSWAKRTEDGIDLYIYFTPNQSYELTVHGIKGLDQMAYGDDIVGKLAFYEPYLLWKLAQDIRMYNQMVPMPKIDQRVKQIEQRLRQLKPANTEIIKNPLGLDNSPNQDISEINIMRGWMP